MGQNPGELALSDAGASKDQHGTEFFSQPPDLDASRRDVAQSLLLALLAVMAGLFLWICWHFPVQNAETHPGSGGVFTLWLLGVSLAAIGTATFAVLRCRRMGAEAARMGETNARLLEERDLLRTIIDALPDYIYAKDRRGRFLLNNWAHAGDLGAKSPAEMKGKSDFDFFPRDLAEQFFADEQQIIATGESVINQEQYKARPGASADGKLWSLSSKVLWRDRNGEVLGTVGITRNIHEFKLTQEALRKSEHRLREVMRRTRCILNFGVAEGPAGWRERALDAVSPFHWDFPVQNAEGAQELCPFDLPPGKSYQQVWTDSRNADDSIKMNRNSGNAFLNDLPFYRNEFRCTDKRGVEHWMQQFVTVEKLAENRWQIFGITTEITELKHSEEALRASEEKLRQFTAQLEQSNRELQDFAYVASHDLQEPLRKIVVFGERLKEKCGETFAPEPRDYVERMQKAAARMQTLINDLLTFSRLTTKANPLAPVNLSDIAREVMEDLESRIEQVKGRVEIGDLPVIDAEALQMRQLLQNLIGNALKFRRPDVPPVVKVAAHKCLNDAGREICELSVSDNGIGFDEKYLDRIFNVFQRLHSRNEYEGTGMGLAIVRKIALYHGGNVTAKSQPGQGATFIVSLPTAHTKSETYQPTKNHENRR